jgi:hypothetical protein
MDSDTILTLENTNDAIKPPQNYIDHQDTDGEQHVAFSSVADVDADNEHDEVKTLRAALRTRTSVCRHLRPSLRVSRTRTRTAARSARRRRGKNATTAKGLSRDSKGTMNLNVGTSKKKAKLQVIKERREGKGRLAAKGEKKSFAASDDQHSKVSRSLPMTSPRPVAFSATAALDQRRVCHGTVDTAAQLHVCKGARGKALAYVQ